VRRGRLRDPKERSGSPSLQAGKKKKKKRKKGGGAAAGAVALQQ